ncbi:MAG: Ig-like domain-containing protein [Tannerella sp.]|jgi:uncharacterized protein YjdB|nr:Ig-like domain-containing protein [Tannerella sp.]
MKVKNIITGFIVILAVAGCGKDKDLGSPAEEAIAISAINIGETAFDADAETICLLKGQEVQLNYTVSPAEGVAFPEIKWSSSDESVVSVSETGKITAVNVGTAIVRVTPAIGFGPVAATPSRTVRVLDRYVYMNSISITGGTPDLIAVGENLQLGATYTTESGDPATFIRYTWSSSHPEIASVDDNGLVTGEGQGEAIITATADDQNPGQKPSASVTVGVKQTTPIETFEIPNDPELERLGYGQEYQIRFNVTPADATVSSIKWESDNESAISVSRSGLLTVDTMGSAMAVITATAGNIVQRVNVAVAQGRLCYSFADHFTPWTVTTADAAVQSSDGVKTTIQMSNPTNEGSSKHRGDINLVTSGGSATMVAYPNVYRYLAVKIQFPTVLAMGGNSNGCIKLEMFDNPRTIGPVYTGSTTSNQNNVFTIFGADAITTTAPNVLVFDLVETKWSGEFTTGTAPYKLVQFKFVIADFPVAAPWTYDIYWVRTFKTMEELTAFVASE